MWSKDDRGCKDLKCWVLAKCLTNISPFLLASSPSPSYPPSPPPSFLLLFFHLDPYLPGSLLFDSSLLQEPEWGENLVSKLTCQFSSYKFSLRLRYIPPSGCVSRTLGWFPFKGIGFPCLSTKGVFPRHLLSVHHQHPSHLPSAPRGSQAAEGSESAMPSGIRPWTRARWVEGRALSHSVTTSLSTY